MRRRWVCRSASRHIARFGASTGVLPMRSRPWANVLGVAAGVCLAFGSTAAALAQDQQTSPPMTVSSIDVENNLVHIVGVDASGHQTLFTLELARLTSSQREALGLPACGTSASLPCPTE